MIPVAFGIALGLAYPPLGAAGWATFAVRLRISRDWHHDRDVMWLVAGSMEALPGILYRDWITITTGGLNAAVAAWLLWRRTRKSKRAAAALGAKSKALRAGLARRMRQSRRPSPVLRPSLKGAS